MEAIGLAGSIIGVIDVVVRTISALRRLQDRWRTADLTVTQIIGQLTSLKAALDLISDWISSKREGLPQHQQLVKDLDVSITCCKTLVSFMDEYISCLEWDDSNDLTFQSKVKTLLQDSRIKDCQTFLTNQGIALNLLLTVMNCQDVSQQRTLLEERSSRQIFAEVKDNSSSLICLRDTASFCSTREISTENSSMLDVTYDFDWELLGSGVYKSQFRALIRRTLRRPKITNLAIDPSETTPPSPVAESPPGSQQAKPRSSTETLTPMSSKLLRRWGSRSSSKDTKTGQSPTLSGNRNPVLSVRLWYENESLSGVYDAVFEPSMEENYILRAVVDDLSIEPRKVSAERVEVCYNDYIRHLSTGSLSLYELSGITPNGGKAVRWGPMEWVEPEWRAIADPPALRNKYRDVGFLVVDAMPRVPGNYWGQPDLLLGNRFISYSNLLLGDLRNYF